MPHKHINEDEMKQKLYSKLLEVADSIKEYFKPQPNPFPPGAFIQPVIKKDEWLSTANEWLNVTDAERFIVRVEYMTSRDRPICEITVSGPQGFDSIELRGAMVDKFIEWWKERRTNATNL